MTDLIKLPNGYTHERLLSEMLQMAFAGPSEKKSILTKNEKTYKMLGKSIDGKRSNVHELLLTTSVESTTLLQTEVRQTLIEGADAVKQARNAFPVWPMDAKVVQVNIGEASTYAPIVAEGAEIPVRTQDISPVTFTAVKRGLRPLITKEMIKFSKFPVMAQEISFVGRCLENSLNRSVIDEFLGTLAATAAYCTDFGNAGATPLTFLDKALTTVKNSGYLPDRVLFHPSCTSAYRLAMQGLNFDVNKGIMDTQGITGKLHGLNAYETGVTDDTVAYAWGWGTDGYLGGVVYDSTSALAIGMAEDINVEDFYDPIHQLQSMSCTMIYDVQCLSNTASNLLQY